jgi:cell division protein FtsB
MSLLGGLLGRLTGRRRSAPRASPRGRRALLVLVGMTSVSLTIAALFGERGLLELVRYRSERTRLLSEISVLEEEVATLEAEVDALANDPAAIERLAREELGLARPGEILVFLDTETSRDPRRSEDWTSPPPSN